ncbi:MAG: GAF domain-containing protein [Neisseria sp.]|nr:GAF domain-containing protein [Neisseria sp.]
MHTLIINHTDKAAVYREILPQIESLIAGEPDLIANLANISAVLKAAFGWLWVGFYLTDSARRELVLGPFQGPLACTRIPYGRGVCGQAWAQGQTLVVEDVNAHPDHIACSSLSQSEIVVPIFDYQGQLIAVLDADADTTGQFDGVDAQYLGELATLIQRRHTEAV